MTDTPEDRNSPTLADDDSASDSDVDAPEPMETIYEAHKAADEYIKVACGPLSTNDPGITFATLALVAELRALNLLLESSHGSGSDLPAPPAVARAEGDT